MGMPEAGNGDVGLFQALPGPHSPKPVRYSPTGDSHWAKDTDAGRISREITGGESSNRTGRVRTLPRRGRLRRVLANRSVHRPGTEFLPTVYIKRDEVFIPPLCKA